MPEKNKKQSKSIKKQTDLKKMIAGIAAGTFAGAILFFLLTLAISAVIYKNNISAEAYGMFILIPSAGSGFVCGYISVIPLKKNGLATGLISGLPLFFIIAAAAIFLSRSSLNITGWTALGAVLACSGAAGILSANKKTEKSKKHKYKKV